MKLTRYEADSKFQNFKRINLCMKRIKRPRLSSFCSKDDLKDQKCKDVMLGANVRPKGPNVI